MACRCSGCCSGPSVLCEAPAGVVRDHSGNQVHFYRLPTPTYLQAAYETMLAQAKPRRPPKLHCLNTVGGAVGRWFGIQGVITLGLDEIADRAQRLRLGLILKRATQEWLHPVPSLQELVELVGIWVLAHELGHELDHERVTPAVVRSRDVKEAAADRWAGWLEAQRTNGKRELGAEFFASIGCNEPGCDHPSSPRRAAAFREGFDLYHTEEAERQRRRQRAYQTDRRPPPRVESSDGDWVTPVLAIGGAILGGAAIAGLLAAVFGSGSTSTYDSDVERYRDGRGRFTKG